MIENANNPNVTQAAIRVKTHEREHIIYTKDLPAYQKYDQQ